MQSFILKAEIATLCLSSPSQPIRLAHRQGPQRVRAAEGEVKQQGTLYILPALDWAEWELRQ